MSGLDAMTFEVDPHPLEDVSAEAERIGRGALAARLQVRLMGGVAIRLTSPSVRRPPYARPYGDFDLVGQRTSARNGCSRPRATCGTSCSTRSTARSGSSTAPPTGAGRSTSSSTGWRCRTRLDLRDRLATDGAHPRPGRPAADQAPDLGDQPEGPRRRGLPARRSPAAAVGRPVADPAATERRRARPIRRPVGPRRPTGASATRSSGTCATSPSWWRDRAGPGCAVPGRRAGRRPPGRHRRRPRSRSAGRPVRGSASGSAGTRRPRRRAARRSATTAPGRRRQTGPDERLAPVVDRRDQVVEDRRRRPARTAGSPRG